MYIAADCVWVPRLSEQVSDHVRWRSVFTRSLDMALSAALNARSYQGVFHCYRPPVSLSAVDIFSLAVFLSLYATTSLS